LRNIHSAACETCCVRVRPSAVYCGGPRCLSSLGLHDGR
jgi:hypothetical protein